MARIKGPDGALKGVGGGGGVWAGGISTGQLVGIGAGVGAALGGAEVGNGLGQGVKQGLGGGGGGGGLVSLLSVLTFGGLAIGFFLVVKLLFGNR